MKPKNNKTVHVVAAVIENPENQIFIAKRPQHVHQGGLWEFPGGKVEPSESPQKALTRELHEELGIQVEAAEPLIQIIHDYPDKSVFLDVWRITSYRGSAHGKEGQETFWVDKTALNDFQFPAANNAIITAATLPSYYLITPEPDLAQRAAFLANIKRKLDEGIRLIQLRAKKLNAEELHTLYHEIHQITQNYQATLLISASPTLAQKIGADGVHLSSAELAKTTHLPSDLLCAASCHSAEQVALANQIGADFIVISPVLKTRSHPNATPLAWDQFEKICKQASMPAYALGGMKPEHLSKAKTCGAQGISAINSLWNNSPDKEAHKLEA